MPETTPITTTPYTTTTTPIGWIQWDGHSFGSFVDAIYRAEEKNYLTDEQAKGAVNWALAQMGFKS